MVKGTIKCIVLVVKGTIKFIVLVHLAFTARDGINEYYCCSRNNNSLGGVCF